MNKVLKIDYKNFDDPKFYEAYSWASSEYVTKVEAAKHILTEICSVLLTISTLITYISSTGFLILMVTIIILIISVVITTKINKININKKDESIIFNRKISYCRGIFQNRSNIIDLFSNNVSHFLFKMYETADEEKVKIIKKFNLKLLMLNSANTFITVLLNIFIMAFLCWQVINGKISIGSFAGMLAATNSLYANLKRFFGCYNQVYDLSLYYEKIKAFINYKSTIECEKNNKRIDDGIILNVKPYSIQFENVNFSYPNSNFSLKNINFSVKKGEKIAIVGENGVGKSTILKLLLRLYDPDSGRILYNNIDLKEFPIKELRREIGLTTQFPNIYALPFVDNICLYNEELDDAQLKYIVKEFNFEKIFIKNNASIDTQVSKQFDKNGILLSGGEKQLLALSRIATKKFGLFILDEVSSSLDPNAEYEFNKKLFNIIGESTAIIIAHRLSSIKNADRILVVNEGSIVESGSHSELIKKEGIYYNMYKRQASGYFE
ncbi:MAG: ABC transporter ATP-binding protein [Bacilli bacterium]|nr:ABC transporter ATP-binding protein [Bacilli bacterium]